MIRIAMNKIKNLNRTNNHWLAIARTCLVIVGILLIAFVVMQFRSAWQGPLIYIDYPVSGETVSSPIITIRGSTANVAQLFINGVITPVELSTERFVFETALPPGASNITLDGYTRSGDHTRTLVPIYYKPPNLIRTLSPDLEAVSNLNIIETPFRPTSDIFDAIQ